MIAFHVAGHIPVDADEGFLAHPHGAGGNAALLEDHGDGFQIQLVRRGFGADDAASVDAAAVAAVLLDIIERKESYLDKQFIRKGITDSTQKINYALTTACGSYKSYKEWKAGIEAEQAAAAQAETDRQYSAAFTRTTKNHPTESAKEDMFIDLEDDD